MTLGRAKTFERRKRVFLGCEGESERSYGRFLSRITERKSLSISMDTVVVNGGSPRTMVQRAISMAREGAVKRGRYFFKALLLDSDKLAESPKGARQEKLELEGLAIRHNMLLIWQEPCHEGFLLRHINGCHSLAPPDCKNAQVMLLKQWPDYSKPIQVKVLEDRLGLQEILTLARQESSFGLFLKKIGCVDSS